MNDTIVIGAGAAGLFAARELARAGKRVVVLESSQRVGGRMLTELETAAGVPIEMGAEFVHGDAPETTKLLDEARLATVRVSGRHFRSDKGQLSPQGPEAAGHACGVRNRRVVDPGAGRGQFGADRRCREIARECFASPVMEG